MKTPHQPTSASRIDSDQATTPTWAFPRQRFTRDDLVDEEQPGVVLSLPPPETLVGRHSDVEEVRRRLDDGASVTLTGPPGVGKTRLAAEVASELEAAGVPGLVVCVEGLNDPRQVAETIAEALAAAEMVGSPDSSGGDEQPVVVLDDCDRALQASAQLARSLVARGMRILATAREPLGIDGESVWRVAPLPVPLHGCDDSSEMLGDCAAVQLFCERAASADRSFALTRENAWPIAEICRRLDGILSFPRFTGRVGCGDHAATAAGVERAS